MEGAEAPDQVDGSGCRRLSCGEAGGDGIEGDAVVGVVEGGDEDERVGDIEVGVAGGEALALEVDGGGHGQGDDLEWLTVGVRGGGVEAFEVLGQWEMVLVSGVGLDAGEDGVGCDEAGNVVDVAVGVVAGASAMQPESLVDAEVVAEGGFQCSRLTPGLRCWTSERRHSSVVMRTPAPLMSMEPPSRTRRWASPESAGGSRA